MNKEKRKAEKRVKTGISGFDELIEGGLPVGKCILLSGTPGTGKTIFSLQYAYNGATLYNEKGLYVSFEEDKHSLKSQAAKFGWDFDKLEKEGKVVMMNIPVREINENTAKEIIGYVKNKGVSRLVIDSLSALSINIPTTHTNIADITEIYIKRFIYGFISELRNMDGVTSILISQTTDGQLSRDTVSEFICDGIILVSYESMGGDYSRSMIVRKMREVKNDDDVHPVEIGRKGMIVHSLRE